MYRKITAKETASCYPIFIMALMEVLKYVKGGNNNKLTLFGCHARLVTEDSCLFLITLLIHL